MQPQEFEDAKLLWKMFYAGQSFEHARAAAEYVLQNKIAETKLSGLVAWFLGCSKNFRPE